uniref:NADH:ubiquinone reductase (H(+)-translocating) n=1 Tax=Heterobothrium okamotoi TaxID=263722 RepID=A0A7U0R666_9PLAT|nr:NADH dehydrogenase subunit 5 [Heterobothrium okamotoi]QQX28222.1 NADH dehydrogenase subunit 5 [Heterobothrium okamotoi]
MSLWVGVALILYYFFCFFICVAPLLNVVGELFVTNIMYSDLFSCLSYTLNNNVLVFLLMLTICGTLSLSYSLHYLGSTGYGARWLYFNMLAFLITMVVLTFTANLITSLIFWEYLGVVSFLLILYYQNDVGLRAALVTFITSRVGDVFLFLLTGYFIFYCGVEDLGKVSILLIFFFVVGSKSAFFPMVSWLLEAMRAPTPVSALVHSSTLVAAGVWFLSEYYYYFYSDLFNYVSSVCCIITIIITFLCGLCIMDTKKIVALSTSNNISWCILFICAGETTLGLLQLLSHGVGKCIFFTLMGDIMGSNESGQNYKGFYPISSAWFISGLVVSLLFLAGTPFIGIYFTKHYFFSAITANAGNIVLFLLSYVCLAGTNAYSVRLFLMCLGLKSGSRTNYEGLFFINLLVLPTGLLLNNVLANSESENFTGGLLGSFLIIAMVVMGGCFGYYSFISRMGALSGNGYFYSVGLLDLLVSSLVQLYYFITLVANVSLYRWDSISISSLIGRINNNFFLIGVSCVALLLVLF